MVFCARLQGELTGFHRPVWVFEGELSSTPPQKKENIQSTFLGGPKEIQAKTRDVRDIMEKATTHQRESRVLEGNQKHGGERMSKSKDWNAEQNKIRTLLLLRLEFTCL